MGHFGNCYLVISWTYVSSYLLLLLCNRDSLGSIHRRLRSSKKQIFSLSLSLSLFLICPPENKGWRNDQMDDARKRWNFRPMSNLPSNIIYIQLNKELVLYLDNGQNSRDVLRSLLKPVPGSRRHNKSTWFPPFTWDSDHSNRWIMIIPYVCFMIHSFESNFICYLILDLQQTCKIGTTYISTFSEEETEIQRSQSICSKSSRQRTCELE